MTTVLEPPVTSTEPLALSPSATGSLTPRRMWTGFAVILSAMILNILDSTIVTVAAPAIQADLAMSTSSLEWVAAAYTLALAVGLMTGARLGDMLGRKRMLMIGLVGFLLASAACSLAGTSGVLIGARVAQGLAAAVMVPQTFGLIRDLFPPQQLGKAFAAFGPVIGLSTVLGPVVAGLLMKADLFGTGWRALFGINLPLGAFALVVGWAVLPAGVPTHRGTRLDLAGTALLLAASVPMFGAFIVQQRARRRAGRDPLVELSVLRKRSYVSGVGFTLVFFGSIVGFSLTMGLFLQLGLGFTAMHASGYLAAMAVGAFAGSGVGAWAATAVGRPILHTGLTIMAVGVTLLYLALRAVTGAVGVWTLAPGLFVFGLGMGMIFVPLFSIIMGEIDDHEVGSASGLLESLQQLGASLGVAVLGTVFFGALALEDGGPRAAMAAGRHLEAAEHTLLVLLVVIAGAWAIGWLLPRKARPMA
jgi:MFS family permease